MPWTREQVIALAPDASSASAGKGLAQARKWLSLGSDETSLWGECQGSGKSPYQACIDLREPAFKCTCPSRKFPCKHGLGLFLLYASEPQGFAQSNTPPWVSDWLKGRAERQAKKAEVQSVKVTDPHEAKSKAAQSTKRAEARAAHVADGVADLERFLRDVIRGGLAALPSKPFSFWEAPAARLVDAQAPGLARLLRDMGAAVNSGEGWQERTLERLGRLFLLLDGFRNLDRLSAELQAEIKSRIGFTANQDDVLAQAGVYDAWQLVAQRVYDEDRLRVKRSWLWGTATRRAALVLQFAAAGQPLDATLLPGTIIDAELCFYPGAAPLRAAIKRREGSAKALTEIQGCASLEEALGQYAHALEAAPWIETFPVVLGAARPLLRDGRWWLGDQTGHALPMAGPRDAGWRLFSVSGGAPLGWAGEWNGEELLPLGATCAGRYVIC